MIQNFYQIQQDLLNDTSSDFQRSIYSNIQFSERLIGIVGPRGVGKTTLLLQYIQSVGAPPEALYVSADNLYFKQQPLFDFAMEFYTQHAGRILCIDEIHRYQNWNQELKNIYDSFPKLQILFSGSSSLDLLSGAHDLSRRGTLYHVEGLSFREFLQLHHRLTFPTISLDELFKNSFVLAQEISKDIPVLKYFREYIEHGYYPFVLETAGTSEYYQKLLNTLQKTIYVDIADYYSLKTENLSVFEDILTCAATTPPMKLNANNLGKTIQKNYRSTLQYLSILTETKLLRTLSTNKTGSARVRKTKKIFIDNTTLLHAINFELGTQANIGTLRELVMLNQLQNAGYSPAYSDRGDMVVGNTVLEIGGKNKDRRQIADIDSAYLVLDDIVIGDKHTIPLYLFGFLY